MDSSDDEDIERKIQRTAIESMPHYSVVGGRKRREERMHQERLQAHAEREGTGTSNLQSTVVEEQIRDEHIEEMLADFLDTHDKIDEDTIHIPE